MIGKEFAALSQAAIEVGSPQIRNVGTIGGNLCQRPRCWYYRSESFPCYKKGGNFCFAVTGENKYHCITGGELCYMVHPSDTAVALLALNAELKIITPKGEKRVKAVNFFTDSKVDILRENILKRDEILAEVIVSPLASGMKTVFIKSKIRRVWDFAVGAVAVSMSCPGGVCEEANVALGAVAPTPIRAPRAEKFLRGKKINPDVAMRAGRQALLGPSTRPLGQNGYKVDLIVNLMKEALTRAAA
jgi:xanthine dehydrogenase YagS FAD-binding subunit